MAITNEELYKEIHLMKDTIDRWRVKVEAKQEKYDKTLYGNGEPGMDEVIRRHDEEIKAQKKVLDAVHAMIQPMGVFFKVGVWVAGVVGLSVIALIWSLITGAAQLVLR